MINEKKYENASLNREKNTLAKNVNDLTHLNIEKDNLVVMLEGEVLELKNSIADLEGQLDESKGCIDDQNFQIEDLMQQCKHWEGKYDHENTV
jgi:chromosome segregation ATPase